MTGTSLSTVSLAWDRSTDRWSFGYEILQDGQVVGSTGERTLRLRHVTPGSSHSYTVRARDHSGNRSPESNAVTATQPPSSDTSPWSVVAVDRSGSSSAPGNRATITVQADQNLC